MFYFIACLDEYQYIILLLHVPPFLLQEIIETVKVMLVCVRILWMRLRTKSCINSIGMFTSTIMWYVAFAASEQQGNCPRDENRSFPPANKTNFHQQGRILHRVYLFVGCLTSQHHASGSQEWLCSDKCMCCHTEIEVAGQTFCITQSLYADFGLTQRWPCGARCLTGSGANF